MQSVDRAVTILEMLAQHGALGVTQLAQQLGVHKSTASRLVGSLELRGLVEQVAERGQYHLGAGILRLASATDARLDLVREARPVLVRLAAATEETVNIVVLSAGAALYVDQVAGGSALASYNWVGQRVPLHATSNGKVLLSGLSPDDVDALLPELPAYTPSTVTDRKELRVALQQVREQGYAVATDELDVGLTAMAAPVHDVHGHVVASLSVSGPSFRIDADRRAAILPLLVEAAGDISGRMGWHSQPQGHAG